MGTSKRALIIDDSRTACLVLSRQLQKLGVMSDSVYSAQSALDYLINERPDVIFLDHSMPGMDGFEAIKLMKSNPNTATIPVVMYTSNSGDVYLSQARALGALDVIHKSMEPGSIGKTLNRLGLIPKQTQATESIEAEIAALDKEQELKPKQDPQYNQIKQDISELEKNLQRRLHLLFGEHLSTLQKNLEENIDYQSKKLIHRSTKQLIEQHKNQAEENTKSIQKEIESSSENIQTQSYTQQQKIKRLIYLAGFQLALIAALITFQWSGITKIRGSQESITSIQKNTDEQHSLLKRVIENQENLNSHTRGISTQLTNNMQEISASTDSRYLTTGEGETIGKILGYSANSDSLNIVNANGYIFQVNSDYQIISPLPKQYFRDQSCFGAAFVKSHKGLIFIDENKALWFTDINSKPEVITPTSFMSEQNCQTYYGESLELTALSRNKPEISGVESFDFNVEY